MSEFRFACPNCGQRISGDTSYMGTQVTCPSCQQTINVPAPKAKAPVASHTAPAATPESKTTARPILPLAIVSLTCSLGLGLGSIPGIICGHLARARIRRDPALRGKGIATAGLVISYSFLLFAVAMLTTGFFVLVPRHGHQLTAEQSEANTPAVLEPRRVDEVTPGDPVSESEHGVRYSNSGTGNFMNKSFRHALSGGVISYNMKVDPNSPMTLYCTYWGNDGDGRRFDILVNDKVIATQVLDFNIPGHFFDVEYNIPVELTRGQTNVTVVFQGYPGMTVGGIFGCQMLKR